MLGERTRYLEAIEAEERLASEVAREVSEALRRGPGEPLDEWESAYVARAEARGLWALQNARREAGTALLEAAGLRPVDIIERLAALTRLARR